MRLPTIIRVVASLLLSSLAVHAQSDQKVTVTYRTFGLSGNINGISFKSGSGYTQLKVISNIATAISTYTGNATMQLYRQDRSAPAAPAGGTDAAGGPAASRGPRMAQVGQVVFPKNGAYLIVVQGLSDGTVQALPMPDTSADFPGGAIRIFNTSSVSLDIQFNEDPKITLKSGEAKIVTKKDVKNIILQVFATIGGKQIPVQNQSYSNDPSVRNTIFLQVSNLSDIRANPTTTIPRIDLLGFTDSPNSGTTASSVSVEPAANTSAGRSNGRRNGNAGAANPSAKPPANTGGGFGATPNNGSGVGSGGF